MTVKGNSMTVRLFPQTRNYNSLVVFLLIDAILPLKRPQSNELVIFIIRNKKYLFLSSHLVTLLRIEQSFGYPFKD